MAKYDNLQDFLTDLANHIRAKKGTTNSISAQSMADEIDSIETGINISDTTATQDTVLTDNYFYTSNGVRTEGAIPNYGSASVLLTSLFSIAINRGYYNGGGDVGIADSEKDKIIESNIKQGVTILGVDGTFTSDANATASNIDSGKTAYVNGIKLTGTSTKVTPSGSISITDTSAYDVTPYATAQIIDSNLIASNIKAGVTVLGITGTNPVRKTEQSRTITTNGTVVPDSGSVFNSVTVDIPTYANSFYILLNTPEISLTDTVITFDLIENADSYMVYADGTMLQNVECLTTGSIDLTTVVGWAELQDGYHTITIRPAAAGYIGDLSNSVTVLIERIQYETPVQSEGDLSITQMYSVTQVENNLIGE